jgi:hypothetical protein
MAAPTPAALGPSAEEQAAEQRARDEAERTRRQEEAMAARERDAMAARLRGRAAFLSEAGEAGFRLGGV